MAEPPPETPIVAFTDRTAPVALKTLVSGDQVYTCEAGRCAATATTVPEGVTDGHWWYFYEESNSENRESGIKPVRRKGEKQEITKTYLRRKNAEGKTETIMESTPLTAPRGLFVSPDGKHVAFWLDNIDTPEKELTELWVYDVEDGGIRLLAEKLYRPDVRSDVYWNTQATYVWFIADTGAQNLVRDQLELLLINAEAPGARIAFSDVPWADVVPAINKAHIDLSQSATRVAYTTTSFLGSPVLMVHTPNGKQRTTIRGEVKYTQWLEDDSLLYAVQDKEGFTFWRLRDGVHRLIARRPGQVASARSDVSGQHIVFATASPTAIQLSSLTIATGTVTEQGVLPLAPAPLAVVWVEQAAAEPDSIPATAGGAFDDAEIAAFIEKNFVEITNDIASQPLRLIMTDQENVVFLDYRQSGDKEHRLQVKVQDLVNTEWSIKARYEPLNREWKKVQGGGLADPTPTRLYEWEESLGQWVLKSSL